MKKYFKPTIAIEEISTCNLICGSEGDERSTITTQKSIDYGGIDNGSHTPSSRSTVWGYEESDSPE